MTLYAWRSQLLSQTYIQDRGRRRPFKLARQAISFVALDVGSGSYVHEQTEEDRKNLPGGTLPIELRKRLAEVGWEQDDLPTDTRLETVRAPISLFPVSQLDRINTVRDQATITPSRSTDIATQLHRKASSSSHHSGAKRRPVFVPALVSLFSSMAFLIVDPDPAVASAAREAILVMLRDDPVMLCRPVMDILSTDLAKVGDAISILRAFLHIHRRLPPSASHHIFTYLGGFLKYVSRDSSTDPKALRCFSYTVPILSKLINQVSNLSIRDLRRSKFEIYVFPSGSLWFPSTAPLSTMFPQSLGPTVNPFDELPPQLVAICMIRTAQNMLLYDMLKQKPQELHTVRKALTGLVLPGENTGKELDARSFLPRRLSHGKRRRSGYHQVSLALARSHLLLVGQVFRTMSRNFNGKAELARLFDGINRILLAHGDDIGIVAHALIGQPTTSDYLL
jgi:Protein UNC80 C-terminal region